MKRIFVFPVLFLLVILGVFMFAGEEKGEAQKTTLLYWTFEDPTLTLIEDRYVQEFQKEYPDVTIKRSVYPSGEKIEQKVLVAFAAGDGPDITNLEMRASYPYIIHGHFAPIDVEAVGYKSQEEIYNNYLEGTLDVATHAGKLYGLPEQLGSYNLLVNKKYFREAGLDPDKDYPKTWEEMLEVAEKITIREGEILTRRAFDFRYPQYLIFWLAMLRQLGGSFLSEDGSRSAINSEAGLRLMQYMAEWGPTGRNFGSPTYIAARRNWNRDDGSIAMTLTGLYQTARLKVENPAFYESKEWMFVAFPRFADAVSDNGCNYYSHFFHVNARKPEHNQKAAWRFIGYMTNHAEEYMDVAALIQPKKSLLESEVFKKYPYADLFVEELAKSHPVIHHMGALKLEQLMKEAVESVMLTGADAKEALQRLERRANEV
ncbi:extracellular solute-binding protein, partial [Candidatus Aerophobetes bacterium]|nr:extracellular solute-binding protein [Candidatus Aerophobetes bacterium]